MTLLPAFGEAVIPVRVRLALALAFTAIITPALAADLPACRNAPCAAAPGRHRNHRRVCAGGRAAAVRDRVAGCRHHRGAGHVAVAILRRRGGRPATGHVANPGHGRAGAGGHAGLHVRLAELLLLSYQLFAPGVSRPRRHGRIGASRRCRAPSRWPSRLAMPFVILSLVFYVALGAINKAMPQLMVAFRRRARDHLCGAGMLLLTAPLILPIWHDAFTPSSPTRRGRHERRRQHRKGIRGHRAQAGRAAPQGRGAALDRYQHRRGLSGPAAGRPCAWSICITRIGRLWGH